MRKLFLIPHVDIRYVGGRRSGMPTSDSSLHLSEFAQSLFH